MKNIQKLLKSYIIKIAQSNIAHSTELDDLLHELSEDTEPSNMEDPTGSTGLKYYENQLKEWSGALKPAKMPTIPDFEIETIKVPESKPATLRPGKVHSHKETLSSEELKAIEDWDK